MAAGACRHESTAMRKEGRMKAVSSVIVLGIGFLMVSGSPARAQLGDLGDAVKKGASDAAKQEVMKAAGLPTPVTPAAAPAADTGAASAPAAAAPAAAPGSDAGAANAPAGEPKVAPGAADAPGDAP